MLAILIFMCKDMIQNVVRTMKSNKVVVVEYFLMSMSPLSLGSFASSARHNFTFFK